VNTLSYKTQSRRPQDVERKWYIVDASNQVLGRLGTRVADVLRGKDKPDYTPHVDTGDYVIVINADKVKLTGNKMKNKIYDHYTGYPGGRKEKTAEQLMAYKPHFIIEKAVKGMIPKNKLGSAVYRKLYVYAGAEHPHGAQNPEPLKLS